MQRIYWDANDINLLHRVVRLNMSVGHSSRYRREMSSNSHVVVQMRMG